MTREDWDQAAEKSMKEYLDNEKKGKRHVYENTFDAAQEIQATVDPDDVNPNDVPQILFLLQGGGFADFALDATDLLAKEDVDFESAIYEALGDYEKWTIPLCIAVEEAQQKDRVVERLERQCGGWPTPIIFV